MKQFIAVLLTILMLTGHIERIQAAENTDQLNTLNLMANEALQLAKGKRYTDSLLVLENIDQLLNQISSLTSDELRIIRVSHNDALKIVGKDNFTHDEAVQSLTKFRLVVDAVSTEYEPLWINMEKPVLSAFQSLKETVARQDNDNFRDELNVFLSMYDVVYPSIMLDVPVERVQKVDAQIQYLEQFSSELLDSKEGIQAIEALQTDLENLFEKTEEDEADPSLWWVIISTGGIIILTLSYVGWKKYKADKEEQQKFRKKQKD